MGLKQPIADIIDKLKAIEGVRFVHIFNNQFELMESQEGYAFPFPCMFVEVLPQTFNQLGAGWQQADIIFRIHIGQEQYDAGSGDMEQNTTIFDLRDQVVQALTIFKPAMCSELVKVEEQQDYDHTNIYHYTVDFITGFIDDSGSKLIETVLVDPIELEVDLGMLSVEDGGDLQFDKHERLI